MKIYWSFVYAITIFMLSSSYGEETNIVHNSNYNHTYNVWKTNLVVEIATISKGEQFVLENKSNGSVQISGFANDTRFYLDESFALLLDGRYWSLASSALFQNASVGAGLSPKWNIGPSNESISFNGPGTILLILNTKVDRPLTLEFDYERSFRYKIISNESSTDNAAKFSVAMDDDGDRVVVGYKESDTNAVVRVYEFDGSSWNQLGENLD